jgi:hypothetical protein
VVRPHLIRQALIRAYGAGLSAEDTEVLVERFGEDLLLLRASLESGGIAGKRPDLADVAEDLWKKRTNRFKGDPAIAQRVALVAGSLGRYDILSPRPFLQAEAQVTDMDLDGLEMAGLLRKVKDYITVGHRSLCTLITDWLTSRGSWQTLGENYGPTNSTAIMLDYLRSLGSGLAVDTLRGLHAKAGFKKTPHLNSRAAALVEIWKAFDAVVERIEHQQALDPRWGNTPSSAMFAVQALVQVGKSAAARPSIEFLKCRWKIVDDGLQMNIADLSTTQDFVQIGSCMTSEDNLIKENNRPFLFTSADQIDLERFHKTWLSGLILCAEAAFDVDSPHLQELWEAVEKMQLESGGFYPERVPWSTARVLLGLSMCGRTIDTSEVVYRAIDWLLRDRSKNGASSMGLWESGTGTWNSTLETTGMVLLTLASTGMDCSDERLRTARDYLLSQRAQWTAPGKALDGALSLQAYLDTGGHWEEVASEAQQLSQWALGEALWHSATVSSKESLQQSCRVAQIASHLVNIGWSAVRSDLPAFLDALAAPDSNGTEFQTFIHEQKGSSWGTVTTAEFESSINQVASLREEEALHCLNAISTISLVKSTVLGEYRRYDERARNNLRDWAQRIENPFKLGSQVHENFLIWAPPGSGKSYLIQEIARDLQLHTYYSELNLAKQAREEFIQNLRAVGMHEDPVLCLIDEIDARADEAWPYQEIFPMLDLNLSADHTFVFVLIGSSQAGIEGLAMSMAHDKGKDLLDRIPADRRFEIPQMTMEDKVLVVASHLEKELYARTQRQSEIEIEKLALYYILVNQEIQSPRQLRDLAITAIQRVPSQEHRIRYDDLFFRGDRRKQDFWIRHQPAAEQLSEQYIYVEK